MAVEVIGTIKPKNGKGFPIVEASDVAMPSGKRLSDLDLSSAGESPTFDLIALGLPAVGPNSGFKGVTCDTSEIRAALDKGAVQFKVKLLKSDGVTEYEATILMGSIETVDNAGSKAFTCSCRASGNYEIDSTVGIALTDFAELTILVTEVNVMAVMANLLHVPTVTEAANGKVLQVVDGKWQAAEPKGADVVVDAELSETSENPVQNKVITQVVTEAGTAMEQLGMAIEVMARHLAPSASIDMSSFDSAGQIVETFADGTSKTTTIEFDASGNPVKITDGDGNVTVLTW